MPDVMWNSGRRTMLLDEEDQVLHPGEIKDAIPLLRNGRSLVVRADSGMVVGTYTTGWVSFPPVADDAPGCCVGLRDEKFDPEKPIVVMLDGSRIRLLPGTATNLIRDAIGGMRFEGEQARTIEFYDPSDLRRRSVTVYVMGVDVPGVDQVRYMAFARDIPRLPWRVEGTEGWRRWLSLPRVNGTFVREDFGVILRIFERDPLVDPAFGDTAMVRLPWPGAPWRRDQDGLTYLWYRGRVMELEAEGGIAQLRRQTGRVEMVSRDAFQDAARLAALFEVPEEPEKPKRVSRKKSADEVAEEPAG